MPKHVIIFSDGTGQAGGLRFDENRSNIYKLYRATRCGPDFTVDPGEQVTFYDPGLGSPADGGHLLGIFRAGFTMSSARQQALGSPPTLLTAMRPSSAYGNRAIVSSFSGSAAAPTPSAVLPE